MTIETRIKIIGRLTDIAEGSTGIEALKGIHGVVCSAIEYIMDEQDGLAVYDLIMNNLSPEAVKAICLNFPIAWANIMKALSTDY